MAIGTNHEELKRAPFARAARTVRVRGGKVTIAALARAMGKPAKSVQQFLARRPAFRNELAIVHAYRHPYDPYLLAAVGLRQKRKRVTAKAVAEATCVCVATVNRRMRKCKKLHRLIERERMHLTEDECRTAAKRVRRRFKKCTRKMLSLEMCVKTGTLMHFLGRHEGLAEKLGVVYERNRASVGVYSRRPRLTGPRQ